MSDLTEKTGVERNRVKYDIQTKPQNAEQLSEFRFKEFKLIRRQATPRPRDRLPSYLHFSSSKRH